MEVGTLNRCLSADGRAPVVWAGRRNVTSLHPESVPFGAADLGGAGCVSRAPVSQGLALLPGGSVVQRAGKRSGRVGTPVSLSPRAAFALRPPPYKMDALEPLMSKRTLEYHWGKHHKGYYDNLNKQIEGTDLGGNTLEEIIKLSYNNGNPLPVFNNAGQAWNHDFFWQSMRPGGGGKPSGEILNLIERDFGSFEQFVSEFKQAGATQFGSGWAWLALKKEKLVVEKTANAFSPLIWGHIPLLTMDVWEHAYYLDYQNRRADYINTFVDKLISWEEVTARLQRAKAFVNLGEPKIPEE